jgi:hypothetical protein
VPDKRSLYITPPPHPKLGEKWTDEKLVEEEKKKIEAIKTFATNSVKDVDAKFAINVSLKEPGKLSSFKAPIIGKVQLIPSTMDKVVFRVDPLPDGAAMIHITLYDASPEDAANDLSEIQSNWSLAQVGAHAVYDLEIPDATFVKKGRVLSADVKVSQAFLEKALEIGQARINKENGK